jgi:hypothetical protein
LDVAVGKTVAKCPNCQVNNTFSISIDIYSYFYFKPKYMPLSLHTVTNICAIKIYTMEGIYFIRGKTHQREPNKTVKSEATTNRGRSEASTKRAMAPPN